MDERDQRILELEFANHRLQQELNIMEARYLELQEKWGEDFSVSTRAARPPQQTLHAVLAPGHPYRVETGH